MELIQYSTEKARQPVIHHHGEPAAPRSKFNAATIPRLQDEPLVSNASSVGI